MVLGPFFVSIFVSIFFFRKVFFDPKTENIFPLWNKTEAHKSPWESKKNPGTFTAPGFLHLVHEVGLEPPKKHLSALRPKSLGFAVSIFVSVFEKA